MGKYQTFIIRFWTDGGSEAARGHIQHVATGRGLYFRDAQRMLRFMGAYLEQTLEPDNADAAGSGAGGSANLAGPDVGHEE
jgi:hypothetical protein